MKKSEMRKAFDKAIRKLNEADCAVQEFASYLVFKGYPLDLSLIHISEPTRRP